MENSFEALIENYGMPKIVIPNTPRTLALKGGYLLVGKNPEIPPEPTDRYFHRRFQHGDSEYLGIISRIETDLSRENELLAHLQDQKLKPIEFIYNSSKNWSTGADETRVAIAADADIIPLGKDEILKAISEKRLIWACDWSSMGDAYLNVSVCSQENLPTDEGVYFLFDLPNINSSLLVGIGEYFDRGDDIMDYCAGSKFVRSF